MNAYQLKCSLVLIVQLFLMDVAQSQTPTESAKEEFDGFLADYVLDEIGLVRYCVRMEVVDNTAVGVDRVENMETSTGYLAVDKKKKFARYDYSSDRIDEEGKEKSVGFRHLKLDQVYYWGQGDERIYRLTKEDKNRLVHGYGRMISPMLMPLGGAYAARNGNAMETVFDDVWMKPDDSKAGWSDEKTVSGTIQTHNPGAMVLTFDRSNGKCVEFRSYLFPKERFISIPGTVFKPFVITKSKWKEFPGLGWLPVETEDVADYGPAASRERSSITVKLTWLSKEFPETVFEVDDLKQVLVKKTSLQRLFEK